MDKFLIIVNTDKDPGLEKTKAINQFLELRGKRCSYIGIERVFESEEARSRVASKITDDLDAVIALGGDGTLIQIADLAFDKGIPILGVNMGNLGFLCEVEKDKVFDALEKLIKNEYEIEDRILLAGEATISSVTFKTEHALNDIVIARKGRLGTLDIRVSVNGSELYTCSSDGMIICTPTGSTGYNISAGGPIVAPYSKSVILTPICAHSLNIRPIVLSGDDEIVVELLGESLKPNMSAEVSFDGGKAHPMNAGDKVTVRKAFTEAKIIKLSSKSFYETLARKMS